MIDFKRELEKFEPLEEEFSVSDVSVDEIKDLIDALSSSSKTQPVKIEKTESKKPESKKPEHSKKNKK